MKKFAYTDEEGTEHEARRINWDEVLDVSSEQPLHAAWEALQSVPSYVEEMARAFAEEA